MAYSAHRLRARQKYPFKSVHIPPADLAQVGHLPLADLWQCQLRGALSTAPQSLCRCRQIPLEVDGSAPPRSALRAKPGAAKMCRKVAKADLFLSACDVHSTVRIMRSTCVSSAPGARMCYSCCLYFFARRGQKRHPFFREAAKAERKPRLARQARRFARVAA